MHETRHKIYLHKGYTSNPIYLESIGEAARPHKEGVKLKLLLKLGDNLYCLRLSNCEPCNGIAQSDMQLEAT